MITMWVKWWIISCKIFRIFMLWEEIRKFYPGKWVVFEAIEAHSDRNNRIVDDVAVIDYFDARLFEQLLNFLLGNIEYEWISK